MKNIRIDALACIIMMLILPLSSGSQEKSDYTTVQQFQETVKAIETNIENAKSSQDCTDIAASVARLETTFSSDKELLNKSLYPDNYDKVLAKLRSKLSVRQEDLNTIGAQGVRIVQLETRITELSDQISKVNAENEKLSEDIKRLSSNIQKLTGNDFNAATPIDSLRALVVQLRMGLQQRDELVYALADSLFLQYDKNISDMKDVEKQNVAGKIEHYGVVTNVKRSIQDNLTFLESTQLKGTDLVTLVHQQQHFSSQWKGLSHKLTSLYLAKTSGKGKGGKSVSGETASVDSLLTLWEGKVDIALWRSLNQLFKDHGFVVKNFTDGTEFTKNFCAFIEEQTQNTDKDNKDTRFKFFKNFEESVWKGDFGVVWLPALVETHKITEEQKKQIEDQVTVWQSSIQPTTNWVAYILVLEGVIVLAIGLIWVMRRRKKSTELEEGSAE